MPPPISQQQGQQQEDTTMAEPSTITANTTTTSLPSSSSSKSQKPLELTSTTIRSPPHSYIHIQLLSLQTLTTISSSSVDELQWKTFLSTALKQFLGIHGSAIQFDILKTSTTTTSSSSSSSPSSGPVVGPRGIPECWIRLPRDDLSAFAAAITAWQGTSLQNEHVTLRLKGASDWLGTLVGRDGEEKIWSG